MSITEKELAEIKGRIAEGRRVPPFDVRDLADEVTRLRAELAKVREVTEETVERSARAAYGPKAWDKLDLRDPMTAVQRSAFMAQIRTALVSAAGGDDA